MGLKKEGKKGRREREIEGGRKDVRKDEGREI